MNQAVANRWAEAMDRLLPDGKMTHMQFGSKVLLFAILATVVCGCSNETASSEFIGTLPGKVDERGFVYSLTGAEEKHLLQTVVNAEKLPLGTEDSEGILTASEKTLPDIRSYSPILFLEGDAAFVRFQQEEPFAIDGLLVLSQQGESWHVRRKYIFGIE